ncbi:MAG: N-acetylmuramoyl-L-alanine amidase, partial [Cyanobium sp.]
MNSETRRPLLLAAAGATALTLGGLLWLSRGLLPHAGEPEGPTPSLLDLLRDGPRDGQVPTRRRVSAPPAHAAWESPLRQACPLRDGAEERRLTALLAALPRHRRRVPIDPSNYGERLRRDISGQGLDPRPRVVVMHETVYGLE